MKKFTFLLALMATLVPSFANAQEVSADEAAALTDVKCKDYYLAPANKNWFLQLGAGLDYCLFESDMQPSAVTGKERYISLGFGLGVGHWFSPYAALRLSAQGGALHWKNTDFNYAKYANVNVDLMWDMFNSLGGINTKRIFSIYPFVGIGAAYTWDIHSNSNNIPLDNGTYRKNAWTLPVSGGLKLNLRLTKYIDFNIEGRVMACGDSFNGTIYGRPIDLNVTLFGGFTFNFGGRDFPISNPCEYLGYIDDLNKKINQLRGEIDDANAALKKCEDQLPCPEQPECKQIKYPFIASVRFSRNSSVITDLEMTHVYNIAQWLKNNPEYRLVVSGYADKNTGNPTINERLSRERAQAVYDALLAEGVDASNITIQHFGDTVQPYQVDTDWNRVAIFGLELKK